MRPFIAFLFLTLLSQFAFSQSARLAAMGNVSMAVPDFESEAFLNPAKAARISGLMLRANPGYLRNSHKEDYSTSGQSVEKSTQEATITQAGFPVEGILSLDPLFVGGSVSYAPNSSSDSYNYDRTYSGSRETGSSSSEFSTATTGFSALGALSLSGFAVGAAIATSKATGEDHSAYRNSSQYGSNSSEYDYESDNTSFTMRAGALLGSTEGFELSLFAVRRQDKYESQPTRLVFNGTRQQLQEPPINTSEGSNLQLVAEARNRISETVLLGGRARLDGFSSDSFRKDRYYDFTSPQSTYERRKTGSDENTLYEGGFGISWNPSDKTLFSAEAGVIVSHYQQKNFYTTSGTNSSGIPYRAGDISDEYELKSTMQVARIGAEISVTSDFIVRAGVEGSWGSGERTVKSNYYQSRQVWTGLTASTLYASGGFSYHFPLFRVDYSFSFVPSISYFSYPYSFYPGTIIYFPISAQDLLIQHRMTGVIQL
ncbi:MAG: hypothetical protein HY562_09725 [Ignavibacteriales bacterium]|nr:hypothetical protein [Ignavibacteriales bacterium]